MALHSYLVFMCLTDKLNENCPQLWTKAWQKLLLQWFEIQRSSWHSSAPNVRPHSAAMHAAGRSHYLVPGLSASEVATQVNRNLKNVFMEIVDVSRLQRAEHIDNCKKRPRSAWNIVCLCGFFAFFLKEKWLGEEETAFLLKWQRLHSHSNVSVCVAAPPALWCLQTEGSLSSKSTNQHQKHNQRSFSHGICWAFDPRLCVITHLREATGSDGFLPAITEAKGCWGSKGHFNLPDSKFWVSSRKTVSWE